MNHLIPYYKPQGKIPYFEKTELEIWLQQKPIKTATQINQEARRYIMGTLIMQKQFMAQEEFIRISTTLY